MVPGITKLYELEKNSDTELSFYILEKDLRIFVRLNRSTISKDCPCQLLIKNSFNEDTFLDKDVFPSFNNKIPLKSLNNMEK